MMFNISAAKSILFILLILIVFMSCDTENNEIGKWDDIIKLSARQATLNSDVDSVIITTEGTWWWINDINVNDSLFLPAESINVEQDRYSIQQDCFLVEKRSPTTLFVQLDANPAKEERIVKVNLEAGDYFDAVTITQEGQ